MATASTNPVQVTYFKLDTAAKMQTAMSAMLAVDYSGVLVCSKDEEGNPVWKLNISGVDPGQRLTAGIGDVLVYDAATGHLNSMPQATFDTNYTV